VNTGRTLFSQVMDFVPWTSFDRIVAKYGGDVRVRTLRCTEQFRVMAFAQMTYRESLRDIEACLGAHPSKLYAMGLRGPIARSTLADANEVRDWHLWADLAAVLIRRARKLYAEDAIGLDLANTVYALDSTTIDLCLSLFPWADFRSTKAAVKMHTLLDLRGPIPGFIHISDGKMGDSLALDLIAPEAGAIYVMDRGYIDFKRLNTFHQAGAFFVTRAKRNMNYHRVYSHAVDKATGVGADQSITLDGFYTRKEYPQHLRRISFCDPETGKRFIFLTNNFVLAAAIVAALYKKRWSVELFFASSAESVGENSLPDRFSLIANRYSLLLLLLLWACGQRCCVVHMSTGPASMHYTTARIGASNSWPIYSRFWLEEAIELSAGRVKGALLLFGHLGDERPAVLIDSCKHHFVDRPLSQPGCVMHV